MTNSIHPARGARRVRHARAKVATSSLTKCAFVRLCTNPAVVGRELAYADAVAALGAMRGLAGHRFIADGSSLADPQVSLDLVATTRQVTDAHLVNLAAGAGVRLASLDEGVAEMLAPADRHQVFLLP